MTTNYHTPHSVGAPVMAVEFNAPLGTLDSAITTLNTRAISAVGALDPSATDTHFNCLAYDGSTVLSGSYARGHIWRSQDKGLTWSDMGLLGTSVDDVYSVAAIGPGSFLAGCSMTGAAAALWRSDDSGATWVKIWTAPSVNDATEGLMIGRGSSGVILIGSGNQGGTPSGAKIWLSTDGGNSFSQVLSVSTKITIRQIVQATTAWVASVRGASPNEVIMYRSTDGGASWSPMQTFSANEVWTALALPGGIVLLGMNDGTLWRSSNSGASYTQAADLSIGASAVMGLTRVGKTVLAVVNQATGPTETVYRSEDEGLTWTAVGTMNAAYHYHNPIAVDAKTLIFAGSNNTAATAGRFYRAEYT
jgi:hypothetical protein